MAMFEHSHDYEAFYVDTEHGSLDEVRDGVLWLRDWQGSTEGLMVTPTEGQLRSDAVAAVLPGLNLGTLTRLGGRQIRPSTWRRFPDGWKGGPVLALWPDERFLGTLHSFPGVEALCVVPGIRRYVEPWIRAMAAIDVRSGNPAASSSLDPIVEQGMLSLTNTVNHSNRLVQSEDKAAAINTLRALRAGGFQLDPSELEAWAIAHDWPIEEASTFREFVNGVNKGRGYRVEGPSWRTDILQLWRERANENR
jgi:hypothetical protein